MKNQSFSDFMRRFGSAVFAAVLFICFALIIYLTKDIKLLVVNTTVNARFWPIIIGIGGCALSVIMLIQSIMEGVALRNREESGEAEKQPRAERFYQGAKRRSLITLALMFLYILGLDYFGFFAMTVAYLFLQILTLSGKENRKLWKIALIDVAFTLVIYLLFRYAFQMMLPAGKFWSMIGG
ncbi:MAG: tripartite tricarboxylate transporter TctB family protein [Candidatus Aphodomonas sp.]|nr:tripartite tricarboxylate transporter TctB family protein [Candidatus Aphodomonas sp.]